MNTSIQIKLTPQEHRELRLLVRRQKVPQREVVRAQMILLLASGENFSATARKVGNARRIVYKCSFDKILAKVDEEIAQKKAA